MPAIFFIPKKDGTILIKKGTNSKDNIVKKNVIIRYIIFKKQQD